MVEVRMAYTKQELSEFRAKLEALERELAGAVSGLASTPEFGDDVEDSAEEAEEAEALGVNLGVENVVKNRLERVREAIRKIDEGTFGVCERCGRDIGKDLLSLNPESELCRSCKSK